MGIGTRAIREMHGLSRGADGKRTPLHRLWLNIRNRCNNPRTPNYPYYGGRGIRVCERWNRFVAFVADVGPHPGAGLTLDRIDVDGHYEPGNVRWATRETQSRNRKYCLMTKETADEIRALYKTKLYTQHQLASRFGCNQVMVSHIVLEKSWR